MNDFTSDGLYIHALREMPAFTPPGRPQRRRLPGVAALRASWDGRCRCARPIVWGR